MKRIIFIVILLILCINFLALNTLANDEPYKDVQPLAEPIEITFGLTGGCLHSAFTAAFIDKMGGFEKVGIKPKYELFSNGPIAVEALSADAWDCGTYGIGGIISGIISQGTIILGSTSTEDASTKFFAHIDSDIVKAGKNVKDHPLLYGSAETWKGKEVYLPMGTVLHYCLFVGLEKFGLKDTDVKMNHMEVPNVNTAMRAGKGEVWGLWENLSYAPDILKGDRWIPVMQGADLKLGLVAALVANPRSYNDPKKREAIKKWVELYMKTVDWVYAGNNIDKAAEMWREWDEYVGVMSTIEQCKTTLTFDHYFTLKENYDMFMQKSTDGKMTVQEELSYKPLMFFISKGNYKPEDAQTFLGGYYNGDIIKELYEASQK